MSRYLALAISAAATVLFLVGLSIGLALGFLWAEGHRSQSLLIGWSSVVEILVWVLFLIAPAVIALEKTRAFLPVAVLLSLGVASVSLVRYQSALWAVADGLGFAMGLLFFRFILGVCATSLASSSRGGRGVA